MSLLHLTEKSLTKLHEYSADILEVIHLTGNLLQEAIQNPADFSLVEHLDYAWSLLYDYAYELDASLPASPCAVPWLYIARFVDIPSPLSHVTSLAELATHLADTLRGDDRSTIRLLFKTIWMATEHMREVLTGVEVILGPDTVLPLIDGEAMAVEEVLRDPEKRGRGDFYHPENESVRFFLINSTLYSRRHCVGNFSLMSKAQIAQLVAAAPPGSQFDEDDEPEPVKLKAKKPKPAKSRKKAAKPDAQRRSTAKPKKAKTVAAPVEPMPLHRSALPAAA